MAAMIAIPALLLALPTTVDASQVKIVNGGYENVIVEISKSSAGPPFPCSQFFANIEGSFRECSRLLHESTEGRAYLRNVTIVVPSSWDTNGCQRSVVKSPIVREADIRIGSTHPLFGDRPWTQQSQNCWKPGDFVSLSVPFLTEESANNSARGLQLFNQWARYRYGVFEDAMCAGGKVCASVKHGRLCNDTSPQSIVLGHEDFKNSQPVNRTSTTFTYWSPTWPKVIVAVDHVIGSVDRDAWNYTRVALRMFLDYMEPSELEFGLVAYSNNSSETFQELAKTKWRNLDHMASMSALAKAVDGESCLHCAMDRAVRMLEANGSSAAGHAVILITNGSLSTQMAANVTILARQKQLRVSVIVIGFKSADQVANDLKQLTNETNGYFAVVPFRKTPILDVQHIQFVNVSAILDLEDALVAALTHHSASLPIDLPVTIHNKMFAMGHRPLTADKEERNGSFVLDSRVKDAILRIYFSQTEHMYSVLGFAASNSTYTLPGKRYFPRDMRPWVYSWPQDELETCFTRPGNWSYKFYRRYPTVQPNYVRVIARLNTTAAKQPKVVLKIIPSNATSTGRFLLLATVQYGHLPILNARVKVSVRSLRNDSQSSTEMDLVDDGNDSDITKGDGVYTAQLEYSAAAAVILSADDNDEAAFSLRSTYRGSVECCDVINVPNEGRESLIPFHLIVEKTLPDANLQTVHWPINLTATPTNSTAAMNPTTGLPTTPFFNSTARSAVPSTSNSPPRSTPSSTLTTSRPTSTSSKPSASREPKIPSTLHTPQTTLPSSTLITEFKTSDSDNLTTSTTLQTTELQTFIPSEPLNRREPIESVTIQVPSTAPVTPLTKQEANNTEAIATTTNSINISSTLTTTSTANVHTSTAIMEATISAAKPKSTQRTANVHLPINLETPDFNSTASPRTPFIPDPTVASAPSNHDLLFLFIPFHVIFILFNYF